MFGNSPKFLNRFRGWLGMAIWLAALVLQVCIVLMVFWVASLFWLTELTFLRVLFGAFFILIVLMFLNNLINFIKAFLEFLKNHHQ